MDNVISVIFVIICCHHLISCNDVIERSDADNMRKKNPGFLFKIPHTLKAGETELVCLTVHDASIPAKAKIDVKFREKHHYTDKILQSGHSCFKLNIPDHNRPTPQFVSIKVQVQIDGVVYSAHNQDPILIYPKSKLTFLESDRSFYKPGDKIKLRILILNNDLKPPLQYKISEVRIRNPYDVSVAIWENITTDRGLAQLEHQLLKDTILGKWKVEVNGVTRHFEVTKYILPRFDISIINPKTIYYETNVIKFEVCSKYSYGKPLKGNAFIKLTDSHNNMKPIYVMQKMSAGCTNFTFSNEQLSLRGIKQKFHMFDPKIHIHITATVTEYGTDKLEIANAKSLVYLKEYHMKIVSQNSFQPGLPYHGKIQFSNVQTNIQNELVEVCYNVAIKKSWNYLNNEQCANFTLQEDNTIEFNILPLKNTVIHFRITARSLNHPNIGDSILVVRLFSSSDSYIVLEQNVLENAPCGKYQNYGILYTTEKFLHHQNITFYYMVKSRGRIYSMNMITHTVQSQYPIYVSNLPNIVGNYHKYNTQGSAIDKIILRLKLDEEIVSKYQLLVYYIANNGESIVATKEIASEACLKNKVEAYWTHETVYPGEEATLNIRASPDSLCSLSAIDSSVKILGQLQNLNVNSFIKDIMQESQNSESNRRTCINPNRKVPQAASLAYETPSPLDDEWELRRRRKRFVFPFSEDFDAYDVFTKFGTIVITNLKVITKACYNGPRVGSSNAAQFLTTHYQYDSQNEDKSPAIRSYFPETWLWELIPVRGNQLIQKKLPHTITTWLTNVMCVSPTKGIGFSDKINITSFQPFFVNILTPYSIKRGELLHLRVIVFNYMNYNLPVRITLGNSSGLNLLTDRRSGSYCISPSNTAVHVFLLNGTDIGTTNLMVFTEIDANYPGQCGPETVIYKRDIVVKTIIVEPEGYQITLTKSELLCGSESNSSNNITWNLYVPNNTVSKTAKSKLSFNADLLGDTIENLDKLLIMPTGCGEQIMATMAPNLYILRYLRAVKKLTLSAQQKAVKNLKIGYQRILNYILKDGSFAPFGYHDPFGSMFLTTFVVKTLQLAKEFIYVDQKIINRAVEWIYSHQLENGCFDIMLHVFQDMGGTDTENSTSGLTSYVILSLFEANIFIPDHVVSNAKYCIRGYSNPDRYTLAISSYALFKANWLSEANRVLKKLLEVGQKGQNMLWWTNKDSNGSIATDIEVTSYVLHSLLENNTTENLANAHSIVRWLTTKKGPYGGFKSTQDTVVALDALSKYAIIINSRKVNLQIEIEAYHQHLNYEIRNEDRLKSKKVNLKEANNDINVIVKGEGCLLIQSVLVYYIKNIPRNGAFKVALEVSPVSTIDQCSITTLAPCITYTGPDLHSNMAVLEVTLPSGYEADRASLYKLTELEKDSKVKMFEEINDQVVLYFTNLGKEQTCVNFNINENALVKKKADSLIKVYDYYKPEFECLDFYKLNSKCQYHDMENITDVSDQKTESSLDEITVINNVSKIAKRDVYLHPYSNAEFEGVKESLDPTDQDHSLKRRSDSGFVNLHLERLDTQDRN